MVPSEIGIIKNLENITNIIETWGNFLLFSDDYVYKIRKTIDYGFMDYSLSKKKRSSVILECELGSRFAHNIYKDPLKLVRKDISTFDIVSLDNSLTAIEYVVKMERIQESNFLYKKAEAMDNNSLIETGKKIANIYKNIYDIPLCDDFSSYYNKLKYYINKGFDEYGINAGKFIDKNKLYKIKDKYLTRFANMENIINERYKAGFIKNCHGNPSIHNIYIGNNEVIGIIGVLEYNKIYRNKDIASDIASLKISCDMNVAGSLYNNLVSGFLSIFNDENTKELINFYTFYECIICMKDIIFMLNNKFIQKTEKTMEKIEKLNKLSLIYAEVIQ